MTREVMEQALDALLDLQSLDSQDVWLDRWSEAITSLREALEQQPAQEQQQARVDVITVNLMREGIDKHRARELADHFVNFTLTPPLLVQEPKKRCCDHDSDCAIHNGDALPVGPCDCSLAAPPLLVQEDSCFCHSGVSLQSVSGGAAPEGYLGKVTLLIDGEYVDYVKAQPPPPVQESVSMRMPKVGDKVICLEDESLGEVVSLTAGGSPDIKFDDGSHGTYLLREFAELFGYVTSPLPVQPEPVTWDKPSASFNEWWNGDYEDPANPFEKDSHGYWAWAGWQAAQRPWVELTEEEIMEMMGYDKQYGYIPQYSRNFVEAITAKLMEKNT